MLTRNQIQAASLEALNFYLRAHNREPSEDREITCERAQTLTIDLIVERTNGAAEDAKERLGRWRDVKIEKFDRFDRRERND